MKKVYWFIPLILLMALNCSGHSRYVQSGYYDYSEGNSSYVYNYLAPYGSWVEMNPYGFVWIPRHMGYRWRPYTDGYWVWSDYGWMWMSNYSWGDIPFHYGRWGWDDGLGWFWVPGDVWGPAWVTWRSSDYYLGWAPLPPGIDFSYDMDFDSIYYNIPSFYWVFVEAPYFYHHRLRHYVLPYERNPTIIKYTSLRNNIRMRDNRPINEGIDVNEVRKITRRKFDTYQVRDVPDPGRPKISGTEILIHRPDIKRFPAGRPKEYLPKDEAQQKLAPLKIWEPRVQRPVSKEESEARRQQDNERKMLNKSQAQEIKDINRKRAEEERKNNDAAQRERIKKDYENRLNELKKSHEEEKKSIQKRHTDDSDNIRQQNQNTAKKKLKKE